MVLHRLDNQCVELEAVSAVERDRAHQIPPNERAKRIDVSQLKRGRKVFANRCIVCHSSIQPENDSALAGSDKQAAEGSYSPNGRRPANAGITIPAAGYRTTPIKHGQEKAVETAKFWQNNFLSSDYRMPITVAGTNPARALGTNGLDGHMWSDFTSWGTQADAIGRVGKVLSTPIRESKATNKPSPPAQGA